MENMAHMMQFWDERYLNNDTGWDLGSISPPLKAYIDQLRNPSLSLLIPGCGNAYEAEYLLQKGYLDITLADISPTLVNTLEERFSTYIGKWVHIHCINFFEMTGSYDIILEQTFFCALEPSLRESYVKKMHELLNPGGKLVGLLFNRSFETSPPYGGSMDEYIALFSPFFEIKKMVPCGNSVTPRQDSELFFIMEKK